jgi:hypothetical protein
MFPPRPIKGSKNVPANGLRPGLRRDLEGRIGQDQCESGHCPHAHHSPGTARSARVGSYGLPGGTG